jgi:adenosylhomocysteine nucleosidase
MAVLYVASEAAELEPFRKRLEGSRKLNWPLDYAMEGILDGRRVMLAANGAGPQLATRVVEVAIRAVTVADLSSSVLEAVVSTGFCGALDPELQEGAIVIGSAVLMNDSGETVGCDMPDPILENVAVGVVVSQNRIANTASEKRSLAEQGAIAVEMEAAGVARHARRNGIPFYCVKVISDRVDESFVFDLNAMRTPEGRIARGKIGKYTLTHPHLLPDLFRLKGRADKAAKELGEFLANCRIKPDSNSIPAD